MNSPHYVCDRTLNAYIEALQKKRIHVCMYVCIHNHKQKKREYLRYESLVFTHASHIYAHTYIHTCIYIHAYIHTYTHT